MNKNIIISIIVIALIVALYFFVGHKTPAPSAAVKAVEAGNTAQTSVSSGVDKANPFNVDVNPYQGYKNPFK